MPWRKKSLKTPFFSNEAQLFSLNSNPGRELDGRARILLATFNIPSRQFHTHLGNWRADLSPFTSQIDSATGWWILTRALLFLYPSLGSWGTLYRNELSRNTRHFEVSRKYSLRGYPYSRFWFSILKCLSLCFQEVSFSETACLALVKMSSEHTPPTTNQTVQHPFQPNTPHLLPLENWVCL